MMKSNPVPTGYDAEGDANLLAASIRKWGSIGFWRGFAGVRSEVLPKGKVNLPSTVFREAALAEIDKGNPDEKERQSRADYVLKVEANLREIQETAINDHFRQATWGQVADIAVGLLFLALTAGLFIRVGPMSPVTIVLISLFAIKLLFMLVSVRRLLKLAQEAFKPVPGAIRVPWADGRS